MFKRFFITGTDTSVGKTVVSRALLQALAARGKSVAGYKPVAKGSKETPDGCFIINTSAALAASSTDIANTIKSRHAMQEQALTQFLQQRQAQGELPAGRDVAQLAQFLNCVLQGMSISAREGADFDKLMQITDTTLRLWPQVLGS